MITDKKIWDYEKARLLRVVNEIQMQLDNGINAVSNYKKEAVDLQKKMWEEAKCMPTDLFDLEAPTQIWQYQTDINNQARKYKFSYDKVSRLEIMLQSPYFGRIDFIENGEENAEQIYIGIYNLTAGNNREILIYDWRAPISGMFYDFETGSCGYDCPAGRIDGQMLLKRQYKINNQRIDYMFDSSLRINDEMLQEILGKSTDSKMKTIVNSIQREQNSVIRNSQDKILIVEGPAGSGKTSIALHRAAYILYKYRESIKSDSILVFSPNHVFESYISDVLPELGEENIRRTTFADFFSNTADSKYRIESMNQQMEYILSGEPNNIRLRSITFKASSKFLDILKKYIKYLEDGNGIQFKDLLYDGSLIISAEDICSLFREEYSIFSYAKRLEKLRNRLLYLLEQRREKRIRRLLESDSGGNYSVSEAELILAERKAKEEYESIEKDIIEMTSFDVLMLYRDLFMNTGSFAQTSDNQEQEELHDFGVYTICQLNRNIINYEDAAPVVFLKTALDTSGSTKSIKHVIIDEAQDYTIIQFEIFRKVFEHCNLTILGDINQSVNGYMNIGSFDIISDAFGTKDAKSISLTKSYRSSKEISDFCRQILKSQTSTEQLDRHGSKPEIIKVDKSCLPERLAGDIIRLKNSNCNSIAVICKTAAQCEALYGSIKEYTDISLVSDKNEEYHGGVVIIPSYLSKGLEFDAVLINSVEEEEYSEKERRLLYTACTRALHKLYLYYSHNMTGLIKAIDEGAVAK